MICPLHSTAYVLPSFIITLIFQPPLTYCCNSWIMKDMHAFFPVLCKNHLIIHDKQGVQQRFVTHYNSSPLLDHLRYHDLSVSSIYIETGNGINYSFVQVLGLFKSSVIILLPTSIVALRRITGKERGGVV